MVEGICKECLLLGLLLVGRCRAGEDIVKRDSKEINERAFADSGGSPAVLVFPWTAESVIPRFKQKKTTSNA